MFVEFVRFVMPRFFLVPALTVSSFTAWLLLNPATATKAAPAPQVPAPAPVQAPETVKNPIAVKNPTSVNAPTVVVFPPLVEPIPTADPQIAALLRQGWKVVQKADWEPAVECFQQAIQLAQAAGDLESEADGYNGIAYVERSTGSHVEAKQLYKQAIGLYHEVGNTPKEAKASFYLAEVYRCYRYTGYYESALGHYKEALALYRKINDDKGEADTWYWMGYTAEHYGQIGFTAQCYQEALSHYQKVTNFRGQGDASYGLGWVAQARGQYSEAQKFYEGALKNYYKASTRDNAGRTLHQMGGLYDKLGDWNKSLECYKKAASECHIGTDGELGGHPDVWWEMFATVGIGASYAQLGDFKQSLEYYNKAADIAHEISAFNYSKIRVEMGRVYEKLGQEEQALVYYQAAQAVVPELLKEWDGSPNIDVICGVGDIYLSLGDLLKGRGDIKGGEEQYQKALAYYSRSAERCHHDSNAPEEVTSLRAVSTVYMRLRQFERAEKTYLQILSLAKNTHQPVSEAAAYYDLGTLRQRQVQYPTAITAYHQALAIQRTRLNLTGAANTLYALGDAHRQQGQVAQSLDFYQRALRLRRTIGDQPGEADTLLALASLKAKSGNLAGAEHDLKAALDLIEAMRNSLGSLSQIKVGFMGSRLSTYSLYIDVLLRQGKRAEAFAWVEKTKARALLDLMNGGHVDLAKHLSQDEQAMLGQLRNVTAQSNQALIMATSNGATQSQIAQKRQEFMNAESNLQNYSDKLYTAHPELSRRQAAKTLDLARVGQFLRADTALLNYVTLQANGVDKMLLFCVTKEGGQARLQVYPIARTKAQLATLAGRFLTTCRNPKADYYPQARKLYDLLLAPAAAQLKGKNHLLLSPDGPLWNVQFAALMSPAPHQQGGKARFVGEQYAVSYAQSATAADTALKECHAAGRLKPTRDMLIMADPDFGGAGRLADPTPPNSPQRGLIITGDKARRPAPPSPLKAVITTGDTDPSRGLIITGDRLLIDPHTGGIRQLPGTLQEAQSIRRDFPRATLRIGAAAQESFFKGQAEQYRVLHLATHGLVNETAPLYSIIVLAQPQTGTNAQAKPQANAKARSGPQEDGYLTARELFDMHLSADMVVLSACDTGRGQNRSGEGVIGLSWALFAAGAPSQVVSQWEVNDASTALLMDYFYAGLKRGESKSEALQRASIKLMHDGKHAHPFYWAPFTLLGDWN